ncbi:MAG: type II toxin-antitoxin system PemK/MazF family toxin [Gemmatimonadetes bacterium]|jgi:mRNA interferase MazF|nr:type II toxin-antitoxin system PemK/MazF family toxin [Gemmatimonadota bacterium]
MRRGELYSVYKGAAQDPKRYRVFVVVSRQIVLDSRFSTAICAPVYTSFDGLSSQVPIGIDEGLKHDSSIHCDELISIPKAALTHFIGSLSFPKIEALDRALAIAVGLDSSI